MMRTLLSLTLLLSLSLSVQADQIRVAVAANFKPVLKEMAEQFASETGKKVSISSASTGVIYNQIINGAPFDLFLSADSRRPMELEKKGLIVVGSRYPYAFGELVLWNNGKQDVSLKDLANYQGRLVIANPAIAPYGVAAQQVLENLSLWQSYQRRLIKGSSVQQAWQFVASGNNDLGIVARSQLMDSKYKTAKIEAIPVEMYAPIQQELVILKRTSQPALAKEFSDWLLSDKGQTVIASKGYRRAKKKWAQ